MTPFLTYELLTPETADPVVIRITGQRERGFKTFEASNGVEISSHWNPAYIEIPAYKQPNRKCLGVWGSEKYFDSRGLCIPLSDWPAVKQAIRELNEHYKEKDMKNNRENISMKEDRYEFPLNEWDHSVSVVSPFDPRTEKQPESYMRLTVTRKKPKVCVEWRRAPSMFKNGSAYNGDDYDPYYIVQFRVTGFAWNEYLEWIRCDGHLVEVSILLTRQRTVSSFNPSHCENRRHFLYIGLDARDKFSCPVLLPESVYSRLDEITKALEDRANGGKG